MSLVRPTNQNFQYSERSALVGLVFGSRRRSTVESSLQELEGLSLTAGATVVLRCVQERSRPDPALFLGRGKVNTLAAACDEASVDLVIFDDELTPGQFRNLEAVLGCRVIDRTQIILDIFASRAQTREGRVQVELAQLKYLLPRLTGGGLTLSRLGAGIGTRGPGETKLETDRRRIRQRIARLGRELETVRRRRERFRDRRHKEAVLTVALVGYTNAGKTSLFNLLTGSSAVESKALFATLDPILRRIQLPDSRKILVLDTVGFIDRLPHTLVAAFRATLEEVAEADLVVHVVDASHLEREAHIRAVSRVLVEVGVQKFPQMLVFNKCDRLDESDRTLLMRKHPGGLCVSARTGLGRVELIDMVTQALEVESSRVVFDFDHTNQVDRERLVELYRHGTIVRQVSDDGRVSVEAEVPRRLMARWNKQWGGLVDAEQKVVGGQ